MGNQLYNNVEVIILICTIAFFLVFALVKKYKKFKSKLKWKKKEYIRKFYLFKQLYLVELVKTHRVMCTILGVGILVFLVGAFLYISNIIIWEQNTRPTINNLVKKTLDKYRFDFLWAQISATLIVSTVVSLLSIFSSTYVYGKKQINVIFDKKSPFSLAKMFICMIILMFFSLAMCVRAANTYYVLISFIVTIIIVVFMLFKIIWFYTHPFYYKNRIIAEYLIREKKHLMKAMPMNMANDEELEMLKQRTQVLIEEDNSEYLINVSAIQKMIEISLIRNAPKTQEYYTELIWCRCDLISIMLSAISTMIKVGKTIEAKNLMVWLYDRLKYNRIVLIQEFADYDIIMKLIASVKYEKEGEAVCEIVHGVWELIECSIRFLYLYKQELDLSYCRLGKTKNIFYIANNNYVDKLYVSIKDNKFISEKDKQKTLERLYDDIRMMEHKEMFPEQDVRDLWQRYTKKEEIKIPLNIKGEPIVMLFLRMYEEGDYESLSVYKTMNISQELMNFCRIVVAISLTEHLNRMCKREYVMDLDVSESKMVEMSSNVKLFKSFNTGTDELKQIYKLIIENYTDNCKENPYSFTPRLRASIETVNNVFYYILHKFDKEKFVSEIIGDELFEKNDEIIKHIEKIWK